MKPLSFRRNEDSLGVVEKTLVVVHRLPLFDHSAVPPCNWLECFLITRAHLMAAVEVIKCAAQFRHNVNSNLKISHNYFPELGGKHM